MKLTSSITCFSFFVTYPICVWSFMTSPLNAKGWGIPNIVKSALSSTSSDTIAGSIPDHATDTETNDCRTAVRAPLKYIGPYPSLSLRFPDLATDSQRLRNVSGVSLDFILDTAANVNTLNAQVAKELKLDVVGRALPGVSSAGAIEGGDTYYLGDAQLEGLNETFTFMTNLTASALPIASPAAAGLLGLSFLQCFEGVHVLWGSLEMQQPPSVTFLDDVPNEITEGLKPVTVQRIPITQLPSVLVEINGVSMPALLDTGSPVTVLNAQAAKLAGVEQAIEIDHDNDKLKNPFGAAAKRMKLAQAAAKGDIVPIMGGVNLVRSAEPVSLSIPAASDEPGTEKVEFSSTRLFVGDLPGLAALDAIGVNAPPALILGTDVLRQRPAMLLRLQEDQVWF